MSCGATGQRRTASPARRLGGHPASARLRRQCRGDSGEVFGSSLEVDRPSRWFSLQVVADDPNRSTGQVSGERTDGLVVEDRVVAPGICNSGIAQRRKDERCIGEEELSHDEEATPLGGPDEPHDGDAPDHRFNTVDRTTVRPGYGATEHRLPKCDTHGIAHSLRALRHADRTISTWRLPDGLRPVRSACHEDGPGSGSPNHRVAVIPSADQRDLVRARQMVSGHRSPLGSAALRRGPPRGNQRHVREVDRRHHRRRPSGLRRSNPARSGQDDRHVTVVCVLARPSSAIVPSVAETSAR